MIVRGADTLTGTPDHCPTERKRTMPRGIPNDPAKRRGQPQDPAPNPATAGQPVAIPKDGYTLPDALKGQRGASLLLDACNLYGVNPDTSLPTYAGRGTGPFRELLAWRFYPGDERAGIPDAVGLVTVGGTKIKHHADPDYPMDDDTEQRLRQVFRAFKRDPKTNEIVPLPLPVDLTLPRPCVSSVVPPGGDHQYRGGYLRRTKDRDAD